MVINCQSSGQVQEWLDWSSVVFVLNLNAFNVGM